MKIQELLDSSVQYDVLKKTAQLFATRAVIAGREIRFIASADGDLWDIQFMETSGHQAKYGKTGAGGEFEVASFVTDSLKEFVQTYHPAEIVFSAEKDQGENRARVYAKIAARVLKGYKRRTLSSAEGDTGELFMYQRVV